MQPVLEQDSQQGKPQHALGIDLLGVCHTADALVEYYRRATQQDEGIDERPQERKPPVAEGEAGRGLVSGYALKDPGKGYRQGTPEVVDRVGDDGHTVGQPSSDDGDYRESEVDEEGREDILSRHIAMQMYVMMVRHNVCFLLKFVNNRAKVRIYAEFRKNKHYL